MKRLHVHIAVEDLAASIDFYSGMFNVSPQVTQDDYAKWRLDDPLVNFAISSRGAKSGINHLGIQVESSDELDEMRGRLEKLTGEMTQQTKADCCYAKADKYWSKDPQGIAWETFHTLESIPVFGLDTFDGNKAEHADELSTDDDSSAKVNPVPSKNLGRTCC